MKKLLIALVTTLFTFQLAFAQMTVNPEHDFYKSVISWQNRGIISVVPASRPYPAANIKEILQTVIQEGTETDKQLAQEYWQEITGKSWQAKMLTEVNLKNQDSDTSFLINLNPEINGNLNLYNDSINIGYKIGITTRNKQDISAFLPAYSNYPNDGRFDPAEIKMLQLYVDSNDIFSFSKNGIIIQGGIFRNGYGDFLSDGVALNDGAFHRPTVLFSYSNNLLSYTQSLSMLGATVNSLYNKKPKDTKYLAFHSFELTPFDWLTWAFYETTVYGNRFDFSYMLPVPFYLAQCFSGYGDSLMMGTRFKIVPVKSLALITDFLVDDLALNEVFKLNFNSKNRISWNTGIVWTPEPAIIEKLALNFLIVTPYTYSHWDVDNRLTGAMNPETLNYQNYTNCGYTIGASIPPNSTKLNLEFDFTPLKNLKLNLFGSLMFHGNIIETLTDDEQLIYACAKKNIYSTDGSIYTHTYTTEQGYLDTAWDYMNFLNQKHKMTVIQAGINAQYSITSASWGNIAFKAGYTFEFTKNKDVDSNIYPGSTVTYDSDTQTYTYTDSQDTEHTTLQSKEVLDYYRNTWASRLHDQTGHFVYIGIEYKY